MNVFMSGTTGFIGKMVVAHLQGAGYQIAAWVRDVGKVKDVLGEDVKLIGPSISEHRLNMELELSDAVVNLGGKPIAGVRWNAQRKEEFVSSRVATTSEA